MKNKKRIDYRLEAKKDEINDLTKVYLYGDIYDERPTAFWSGEPVEGDFIIPKEVRTLFEGIDDNNIELHLNSYGGSVFASIAIYNYLINLDKTINTVNDGICASGASIILMAGEKIKMPENTQMMIHKASTFGFGNSRELKEVSETLDKIDNGTVIPTYMARFNGSKEQLNELLDKETWLTAKEALDYGLIDEMLELRKPKEKNNVNNKLTEEEITNGIKFMKNFANLKLSHEEE